MMSKMLDDLEKIEQLAKDRMEEINNKSAEIARLKDELKKTEIQRDCAVESECSQKIIAARLKARLEMATELLKQIEQDVKHGSYVYDETIKDISEFLSEKEP